MFIDIEILDEFVYDISYCCRRYPFSCMYTCQLNNKNEYYIIQYYIINLPRDSNLWYYMQYEIYIEKNKHSKICNQKLKMIFTEILLNRPKLM